ncbi:PQQ-binding-like beta-propeller repeat protein [Streptomyces sp. NPDC047525]|uniref:serine/threonine-protein kinase n=1 Tax=Streptomyces sp. NPDC047525 TaxID=3155264 RepID=UPI0033F054D1
MDALGPLLPTDPDTIGDHRLVARLGSGGMGTVYLARTPTGRTVALKAVRAALADNPSLRARFREETQAAHTLGRLPHFPELVDAGELWFATAYVLGPSLADAVSAYGPWPEPAVRALAAELATALEALHGAGYVHRDLKPSNVLLTPAGPRLIDLGLAQATGAQPLTAPGELPGTPAYMAPEQTTGGRVGPPCDVYALGAVLVLAATGRPPHGEGEPGELLYRIAHQEPELAAVPEPLRPLAAACLARDPAARPAPADVRARAGGDAWFGDRLPPAVLADIAARTASVGDTGVRRHTEPEPGVDGPTRRRLLAGGAALAVVGAGGGTAWWLWGPGGNPGSDPSPSPSRRPSKTVPGGAPQPLWSYRGDLSDKGIVPALPFGDVVVVPGAADGSLLGIDARRGTLRWRARAGAGVAPTPCADACVQPTAEPGGRLAVVEAGDGRTWTTGALDLDLRRMRQAVVAYSSRAVYVMGHEPGHGEEAQPEELDRFLVAYDVRDRRVVWRRKLARSVARTARMAGNDRFALLLETDSVTAYRTDSGKPAWRRTLATERTRLDPTTATARRAIASDDRTVVVSGRGCLVLELATGRTLWSLDPEEAEKGLPAEARGRSLYGAATIEGETIYFSFLGREMWAVQRTRRKQARKGDAWRWKSTVPLPDPPAAPPLPGGRYLFPPMAPSADAAVIAVDRETFRTAWTYTMPDEPEGAPRFSTRKNRLYVTRGRTLTVLPLDGSGPGDT